MVTCCVHGHLDLLDRIRFRVTKTPRGTMTDKPTWMRGITDSDEDNVDKPAVNGKLHIENAEMPPKNKTDQHSEQQQHSAQQTMTTHEKGARVMNNGKSVQHEETNSVSSDQSVVRESFDFINSAAKNLGDELDGVWGKAVR